MKVLVLGLRATAPDLLLGDDRLAVVRHLMEAGLYGRLEGETPIPWTLLAPIADEFARSGRRWSSVDEPGEALGRIDWDVLFAVADGPGERPRFDDELGNLLGMLDESTAVLIVSDGGGFVLAGPGVPSLGEVAGARPIDLAPTLLALAGLDVPESMPGRPLVPAADAAAPFFLGYDAEEESALLGRLSGLGYI